MSVLECERTHGRAEWMTLDDEMVELTVLMSPNQMWELEQVAQTHGVTVGKLVRRVLSQVSNSHLA